MEYKLEALQGGKYEGDSDGTEMMHMVGDASSAGGSAFSSVSKSVQARGRHFKSEITPLALVKELKSDENADESKSDIDDDVDK